MENQTPVTPVNQKTSNFLVILLSILLFISVVIAVFFALQTQRLNEELKQITQNTIEPTTEPVALNIPMSVGSTTNWKTHKSKGIEFKLPSYFVIDGDLEHGFARFKSDKFNITLDMGGNGFGVQCINNISSQTLSVSGKVVSKITYQGTSSITEICNEPTDDLIYYWLSFNSSLTDSNIDTFLFSFSTKHVSKDEADTIFDQILSTFKFTN